MFSKCICLCRCIFAGQVLFSVHSDQMSQRSVLVCQLSKHPECVSEGPPIELELADNCMGSAEQIALFAEYAARPVCQEDN